MPLNFLSHIILASAGVNYDNTFSDLNLILCENKLGGLVDIQFVTYIVDRPLHKLPMQSLTFNEKFKRYFKFGTTHHAVCGRFVKPNVEYLHFCSFCSELHLS